MSTIEQITQALQGVLPGAQVKQLQTALPGDDDGIWFVSHPKSNVEVNLESHTGDLPFLIENSLDDSRITATTIAETIAAVARALGLDFADVMNTAQSFSLEQGHLQAWIEHKSLHIIAREPASDEPVELNANSARRLAEALAKMADQIQD